MIDFILLETFTRVYIHFVPFLKYIFQLYLITEYSFIHNHLTYFIWFKFYNDGTGIIFLMFLYIVTEVWGRSTTTWT